MRERGRWWRWARSLAPRLALPRIPRPARAARPASGGAEEPSPRSPPPDGLARAFEQLCRELGRPFTAAEIRAAAPPNEQGMTLGNLLLAAERLGFKAGEVKPDPRTLAAAPPPFLVVGRRPGEGWLVRRRVADHLLLQDPGVGAASALHVDTVADLARRVVLLKALPESARPGHWRQSIMRRLRPVLWELGLASVVINVLALATPIFLMTVYNTDDVRPAAC